ncbi:conserved hypothetical protein [Cotesia vestalis bracovirus]|nr:conserved hypothetical protein [Cotesia vestalis bracovirus]
MCWNSLYNFSYHQFFQYLVNYQCLLTTVVMNLGDNMLTVDSLHYLITEVNLTEVTRLVLRHVYRIKLQHCALIGQLLDGTYVYLFVVCQTEIAYSCGLFTVIIP